MKIPLVFLTIICGLVFLGFHQLNAQSEPTPQEVIAGLMGTWVGTITLTVNGKVIKESYTETITPLGTNGLGYQSVSTGQIGKEKPVTGTSYQYDNGQLDGSSSQGGNTTAVLTGSWSIQNSTIYGTATATTAVTSFTENTQTFVTGQTMNSVVNYSFGGGAVGTAIKVIKPDIAFNLPPYNLAYSPKEKLPLNATSPSKGLITYSSSDPAVLSILGKTAIIKGVGSVTITATQAAKDNYTSATATSSITIDKTTPFVDFTAPKSPMAYALRKTFILTEKSTSGGLITFNSSDPSVISILGKKATILKTGTVILAANVASTKNYTSGTDAHTIVVR